MSSRTGKYAFVTLAVPFLNEERYLARCVDSLAFQLTPETGELLLLDGGSADGSPAIAAALAARHPHVKVIANPRRIQSAALNLASRIADPRASVLARADAHNVFPPDFVARCAEALRVTGATSVVVPIFPRGEEPKQKAIAAAMRSLLGNGGAAHRRRGGSRFVEHGHHAAFDIDFFRKIGGYDETFRQNEDVELDQRAIRNGGRIWLCAEAAASQFPRRSFADLAIQYYRYGAGRAATFRANPGTAKVRHLASLAVLLGNASGLGLAAMFNAGFASIPLSYALICVGWGVASSIRSRDPDLSGMGLAAMVMHHSWALGFCAGITKFRALKLGAFGRS
jgi:succinoglycan biosynthesis protein ExoA